MKHPGATLARAAVLSALPAGLTAQSHPQTRDGVRFDMGNVDLGRIGAGPTVR